MFKKKKKNEYQEANEQLKKKTAYDRLYHKKLKIDDDGEILAREIMAGNPVAINIEDLDARTSNKILAFLTGVVFALDGVHIKLKENVYLFTVKSNIEDGSLDKLLNR